MSNNNSGNNNSTPSSVNPTPTPPPPAAPYRRKESHVERKVQGLEKNGWNKQNK